MDNDGFMSRCSHSVEIPVHYSHPVDIRYEDRNGRRYAYRCTSKRVPGRKNPVSVKEYLGVVDLVTNEIIPKKERRKEDSVNHFDNPSVLDCGNVLIVKGIADRLGITADLEMTFGESSRMILALVLARAIRPLPMDKLDLIIASSTICDEVDITPSDVNRVRIRKTINDISFDDELSFFTSRWSRNVSKPIIYVHPLSGIRSSGRMHDISGYSDMNSVMMIFIMSESGKLIGGGLVDNSIGGASALRETILSIGRGFPNSTFIASTSLSASLDISDLIRNGINFVIPYVGWSDQYRSLESDYEDIAESRYEMMHGNDRYHLKEGRTGLMWVGETIRLVPESDPAFRDCHMDIRTFMCYDPRIRVDSLDFVKRSIEDIRSRLDGHISDDPEKNLLQTAGSLSMFLRYAVDGQGRMRVVVKRKEMSEFHREAGKTIVLASSASWNDVIAARVARAGLTKVMDQYHIGSGQILKHVGRGIGIEQSFFIDILVLSIYSEMQRLLDNSGIRDVTVEEALTIASTYKIIKTKDGIIRSSRNRKVPRLFRIFGIDDR